jgi:hypothetical protein
MAMPVRNIMKLPRNTPSGLLRLTFISSPMIFSLYGLCRLVRLIGLTVRSLFYRRSAEEVGQVGPE